MTSLLTSSKLNSQNKERLLRIVRTVNKLPAEERPLWKQRVRRIVDGQEVGGEFGTLEASMNNRGESEPSTEWDLWLANKLDGVYQVVSDRAEVVGKKVADGVQVAGFSLWPLALVGVVYIFMKK